MVKKAAAAGPVEGRWALPDGWSWHRARDVAKIVGGSTPKNAADTTNYTEDGTPWLTPADLSGYSKSTIDQGRRNLAPHVVNRSSLLPAGAVLISSRAPVGYCAVAANPMVTNQGFRSLILADHLDPFFVRYYVLFSRKYLEDHASGTTFKELSGGALGDLVFPVPPLGVQRQIVARIDVLFAEIDDGEAALARARDDLAKWRKALLKAAVTGELTSDWRAANLPTGSGAEFLARIRADRRVRWESHPKNIGKRYKEAVDADIDGLAALPNGWTWMSVDQLTADQLIGMDRGSPLQSKDPARGAAYIKMNNVTMDGRVLWENLRYVEASEVEVSRFGLDQGDILFNTRNSLELVGKVGLVTDPPVGAVYNNNLLRLRLGTVVDPAFVTLQMNALPFRKKLEEVKRATTSVAAIYVNALLPLPLAIPPLNEQREIVRRVQDVMHVGMADALDVEAATLRQSILAAAFRGELA